jgi:hypothetical protein
VRQVRRNEGTILTILLLGVTALLTIEFVPARAASPKNACEALTLNDVQRVLGGGFTAELVTGGLLGSASICYYRKAEDNSVSIGLSQVSPGFDSAQSLKTEQAGIKQQQGGAVTVMPVSGLGEGAYYALDPGRTPVPPSFKLRFAKGDRLVTLDVETGGKPDVDAAVKLAKVAYARL